MDVSASIGLVIPGMVFDYAGSTSPSGFLLCYGQEVSRSVYADLFSVINTQYGIGNGTTTFNIPDLRGRAVAGADNMGGSAASRLTSSTMSADGNTLGATGGAQTVTLTGPQSGIAAHTHANTLTDNGHTHSGTTGNSNQSLNHTHGQTFGYTVGSTITSAGTNNTYTNQSSSGGTTLATDLTAHTHSITTGGASNTPMTLGNVAYPDTTAVSSHINVQPTMILNKIIKY